MRPHRLASLRLGSLLLPLLAPVPAAGEVLSRQGDVTPPLPPPASVSGGVLESDDEVVLFLERENLRLTVGVDVDLSASGAVLSSADLSPGSVAAGRFVDSWYLHADPIGAGPARVAGAVRFDRPVLGVITDGGRLLASEPVLGHPGTTYAGAVAHVDPDAGDHLWLSDDRRTLAVGWPLGSQVNAIRVLTEGTASAPYLASYAQMLSVRGIVPPGAPVPFDYGFDNAHTVGNALTIVMLTEASDVRPAAGSSLVSPLPFTPWYDSGEDRWLVRRSVATGPAIWGLHTLLLEAGSHAFVHTTEAANTLLNWSCFDHPDASGDPDARVLVSRNGGTGASPVHHDHPIGVYYESFSGRWCVFNQDQLAMPLGRTFHVMVLPDDGTSFVHSVDAGNAFGASTRLDHPLLNDRPEVAPQITALWNPGGVGGVYDARYHALEYNPIDGRWWLRGTPGDVPAGASYVVYVPPAPAHAQVHTADLANTASHQSEVSHPHMGNTQAPIVFESQSLAGGAPSNPHATGIWFAGNSQVLFNQDQAAWPLDAASHVFRAPSGRDAFVHVSGPPYDSGPASRLDHWRTVGHPEAIVFVTQKWNPGGALGGFNDQGVGVFYDGAASDWSVYQTDFSSMPDGRGFNVYVAPPGSDAFVHVADAGNTLGAATTLDHPLLNGQPAATPIVTNNFNPLGSGATFNDHPVAVDYDEASGRWQVVNQDGAAIAPGVGFNVLPLPEPGAGVLLASGGALLAFLRGRRRPR